MICPYCKAPEDNKILETRHGIIKNETRRRRECNYCGGRWRTKEVIDKIHEQYKRDETKTL